MNVSIVPLAEIHFEPLRRVVGSVAEEKRFLALTETPSREEAQAFYRNILERDLCQFVALLDGEVVGWCDVLPTYGEARRHVGILGIGLISAARHQGIGKLLMKATIAKAWTKGLTRIELTVRVDNANARALYEHLGFQHEGIRRREFRIDGRYYDGCAMALLRDESA